ncbi:MAG: ABC-F family ATP-binding cassette domain-containing protein [Anaerolineae bacterium]|nr:ABC-F family ATP-binding cassette domain-containing protein [Anaerolineae bacterium]
MSTIIVNLDKVTYHHGPHLVLNEISWEMQAGQKIGLVGPNGAGKSTLLRLITGELTPDDGFIFRHKKIIMGYLAQEPQLDTTKTVWEETIGANPAIQRVEAEMRHLEAQMADPAVYNDTAALNRVLAAHARAQEAFEQHDGYSYENHVQQALQTVGFAEKDFELPVRVLSGGQQKMVGLAKLLALKPDLLLLDEPDNHLDLAGKTHLEHFIQTFPGTVIIVSHDRYLLDEVAQFIVEVEAHKIALYQGNYSAYATGKQLRLLRQQQLYEAQQKEISRIEAAIARFEYWASIVIDERHIRQARSRQKMLERMDKIEKPVLEHETMGLELNGWRGSNKVLDIVDLDKVFESNDKRQTANVASTEEPVNGISNVVLLGLNLRIWHGERVGLIGENGTGKSVLFRCILGQEEPTNGIIKIGPSVQIGYYAQQHETLDPNRTLIEEIWEAKSMSEHAAVNFLRRFLFPYERTRDKVATLSGGERSRLQLAKLMLSGANFLLLDEPTNNLDLPSCEVLEQALEEFEGTVLVISHDRYFLDRIVERIVELEEGALVAYNGDYTYYAEKKEKAISH